MWSRGSSVTIAPATSCGPLSSGDATRTRNGPGSSSTSATASRRPPRTRARSTIDGQLINGGAVLGYGTAAGGRMAITAAFETGDIIDPSTGKPRGLGHRRGAAAPRSPSSSACPTSTAPSTTAGWASSSRIRLKELAPLRATDSAEIVGGRAELGWVALLLAGRPRGLGDRGPWSRPHPGARRPARSVASDRIGGQISPTSRYAAGCVASQPDSPRSWAGPWLVSSDLAPPLDPSAPREVEPIGNGRSAMTTISPLRPGSDGRGRPPRRRLRPALVADAGHRPGDPEARAARLRLRKRLILWSLPFVVVLALVATKLLTMVAFGDEALRSYTVGQRHRYRRRPRNGSASSTSSRRTRPRSPVATPACSPGTTTAPARRSRSPSPWRRTDSRDACQVRVNLSLSLEKLGQAAQNAGQADQAKQYFDRMQEVVSAAPPGCFEGDAQNEEGQQLRDAQQRAQDQNQQQQDQQNQQNQDSSRPAERGQAAAARRQDAGEPPAAPAGRRAERRRDQAAGRQALVTDPARELPAAD